MTTEPLILALVGPQGSGKTHLAAQLIAAWTRRGLHVVAIKHDGHLQPRAPDDWEKAESDTATYVQHGAVGTLLTGGGRTLWRDMRDPAADDLWSLCRRLIARTREHRQPLDVILVEGFKFTPVPKVVVLRRPADVDWFRGVSLANLRAIVAPNHLNLSALGIGGPVYRDGEAEKLAADVVSGRLGNLRLSRVLDTFGNTNEDEGGLHHAEDVDT
ncbi:molybdopterin-guanine dinucleotide biosynthesis protein B [Alicyclobacillus herbarius]|uniref:molybdopterin-guanine dinucleotide biosynthesis protein B n=1 Tax=Alicyclobacillus herbarius TaxID=122960 RepID=UPI0004135605|nr:molybdopterin-guanine dinucleotide biosynthesis protein MobB [Alicyclobacillus herbarius]